MASSFNDLPVELKQAIIRELSLQDQNNLSKTCKVIRKITLPAMLREIDLSWDAKITQGPAIAALIRSILVNPFHGQCIESLTLHARNYRGFQLPGFNGDIILPTHTHRITATDWDMFEKALLDCPCEEHGKCDDPSTRERNLYAGIAILISRCMRLESLEMDIELLMDNYRLPGMLSSTIGPFLDCPEKQSWFTRLTNLKISHQGDAGETKYASSLPVLGDVFQKFFYLPALRTLELVFVPDLVLANTFTGYESLQSIWPFSKAPVAFHLTKLQLRRSSLLPRTLSVLLAATPNLTTLYYDFFSPDSRGPLCLASLHIALTLVRKTLRHLSIRTTMFQDDCFTSPGDPSRVFVNTITSLRDFDVLETLETSLLVLYGQESDLREPPLADILPLSLRRLVLVDDVWHLQSDKWYDLTVQQLLKRWIAGQRKDSKRHGERRQPTARVTETEMDSVWMSDVPYLVDLTWDLREDDVLRLYDRVMVEGTIKQGIRL